MMRIKTSHMCVFAMTALFGCGRAPEPVAQQAALSAESERALPAASFSVDRAVESTRAELERLPMEERFEIRGLRVAEAEEAARRASVDEGGDVMRALEEIRTRMSETPEAAAEYAAAEQARIQRNEGYRVTDEDRANFARNERAYGVSRGLAARAAAVREARREDIAQAAAHVDPPESARAMPTMADLSGSEANHAH
jgi:hypothetical protein